MPRDSLIILASRRHGHRAIFAVVMLSAASLVLLSLSWCSSGRGRRSRPHAVDPVGTHAAEGDLGHVHATGGERTPETRVYAFRWEEVVPELAEVASELSVCAKSTAEAFKGIDIARLFACDDPSDGGGGANDDPYAKRCF